MNAATNADGSVTVRPGVDVEGAGIRSIAKAALEAAIALDPRTAAVNATSPKLFSVDLVIIVRAWWVTPWTRWLLERPAARAVSDLITQRMNASRWTLWGYGVTITVRAARRGELTS